MSKPARAGSRKPQDDAEVQREAQRILDRVERESHPIGFMRMPRVAKSLGDHFSAADAPAGDPVEQWGRRIGRILAAILVVVLIVWLVRQIR